MRHSYTVLEWLDCEQLGASGKYCIRHLTSDSPRFLNCIAKNATAANGAYVFNVPGATLVQCLAHASAFGFGSTLGAPAALYNCMAANCSDHGFYVGGGGVIAKNCVAYNCGVGYRTSGFSEANSSNNATSAVLGTYLPGTNGVSGITSADFVNAAGKDFHLSAGSVLRGAGVNLYSNFTTDIDGDTWPSSGAWDIGFDYYVAAGSLTINSITASNITSSGARITLGLTR